jgi:hypothetical protein
MPNVKSKKNLIQELGQAAETGDVCRLQSTLAAGVDVNETNAFGTTALMRAASRGDVQMVAVLLSHGADPNRRRHDTFTALALAAFFGHEDVVRCLVEYGADATASTRFGTSPQMWASAKTHQSVAGFLGDKDHHKPRPVTIANSTTASSTPFRTKARSRIARLSFPLTRGLVLSSLLLILVGAFLAVAFQRRQPAVKTTPQSLQTTTENAQVKPAVEKSVGESQTPPPNSSADLNHYQDPKGKHWNPQTTQPHTRVALSPNKNNEVEQPSPTLAETSKTNTQVAPPASTPNKASITRPVLPSSRPPTGTTQLISSPKDSTTKSKVIQWP